ncbi:GRF1-interacting factor 2-like [Coffea eugenioides]|uniref:GRF1-interacting factor 3 isoform X1 n=1 Tax=Coffea arabica TaxID=13443 RepID=A0A6P6W3N3_COFAR|nr:GRF1-interacting factor 2-like [Coffea arabica]XP_027161308.1 GRF1-interacting factor 2-like [Coffea eugenioides]
MQQQQQPTPALTSSPPPSLPFSPNSITTEQIQKCLDDNKNLILAILENQNLGKVSECAQYQAVLQRNLMYLAAIADAQPQPSATPPQLPSSSGAQQGIYVQQAQATTMQQHQGVPVQKLPFQLSALRSQDQQHQLLHFQAQQQFQGQGGSNHGMHQIMQTGLSNSGSLMEGRGSKQSSLDANSGDGQGK